MYSNLPGSGVGTEIGEDIESCCELRYQVKYAVSTSLVGREGSGMKQRAQCLLMEVKIEIEKLGIECGESTFQ
jgi:hypothetical protein